VSFLRPTGLVDVRDDKSDVGRDHVLALRWLPVEQQPEPTSKPGEPLVQAKL
jgi:hypothetical protein